MIRILKYHNEKLDFTLSLKDIKEVLDTGKGVIWLDLKHPHQKEYDFLKEELNFHPLAVEDSKDEGVTPKFEDYGDFLFFVFRGINYFSGTHALDTLGIKIFFTKNLLVTVHHKDSRTIKEVEAQIYKDPILMKSTEKLLFLILNKLTDNILPVIEHVEDKLEKFQHHIFKKFSPEVLEETFELKKWILRLKRFIHPQYKVIEKLIKIDHPLFSGNPVYELRNILEDTQEVIDHLEIFEELFPDAINSYLSQVTNRMNEVMKTMSVIATLMLPLSFISSVFGMNFSNMPLISQGVEGFWIVIGLMATIFCIMVYFFYRKDWF